MNRFISALSSMILLSSLGSCQASTPKSIVDQFFPAKLIEYARSSGEPLSRKECFVVYDSLPNGSPKTIVAAYTDGYDGTIRVISFKEGSYQVAYEPPGLVVAGTNCVIDLADVDGDGRNEIRVAFASFRANSADWIFRWDGTLLTPLNPTSQVVKVGIRSQFVTTDLVDLYHDGTLQVVSVGSNANTLYRFNGQSFSLVGPVLFYQDFVRSQGEPRHVDASFDLTAGISAPFQLRVVNGEKGGANRVSSAHVVINGVEVVAPSQLNQQVDTFDVILTNLKPGNNSASVIVEGQPGAKLTLAILGQTSPTQ